MLLLSSPISTMFHLINNSPQAEGTAKPSYAAESLSRASLSDREEYFAKVSSMDLYAGGSDTVRSVRLFIFAYLLSDGMI